MAKQHEQDVRCRLSFVRYLFTRSQEEAKRPAPQRYAALLTLHDAVELFLVFGRERKGDPTGPKESLLDVFEGLTKHLDTPLSYKAVVKGLNASRRRLKHHGEFPNDADLGRHMSRSRKFFFDECPKVFGIEFDAVNLADFVRDPDARRELEDGYQAMEVQDYEAALRHAAASVSLLRKNLRDRHRPWPRSDHKPEWRQHSTEPYRDNPDIKGLMQHAEDLEERVQELEVRVEFHAAGISESRWEQFRRLTPAVRITAKGDPRWHYSGREPTKEAESIRDDALYCLDFAVEACLRIERRFEERWSGPQGSV